MWPEPPKQAPWIRAEPRRCLPSGALDGIVQTALPGARVLACEALSNGLRNANFKLRLDRAPDSVVLRIYEHDASLCRKEIDLMSLAGAAVPVPEVLHAEPEGWADLPPFLITRWIEGISFRDLKRSGDRQAIAEAAGAVGETLAAIGRFTFPKPGWLLPGPAVGAPLLEGADALPRFIDLCLATENLRGRMSSDLREGTQAEMWRWAKRLAHHTEEACLAHGDFNRRNLLVHLAAGRWRVAAVLDWEFAVSGSPLADIGSFLRYERAAQPMAEPHFSEGYQRAGGQLPADWRRLARLIDLAALCESLTHDALPDTVTVEIVEIVRAVVEDRDRAG